MAAPSKRGAASREPSERTGKRALLSWALFDWATQPFYTLVVTFLFAPYFVNGFMADPAVGSTLWAYATRGGELIAGLLAPVLRALSPAVPASSLSCFCPLRWPPSGPSSPPCSTTP